MAEKFDPYHKWLGIPAEDQPPNYYQLLGLVLFEGDEEVIDTAANRRMSYLQGCASGPHVALSQKILNEVMSARLALLNVKDKKKYDSALRKKIKASKPVASPSPAPSPIQLEDRPTGHELPAAPRFTLAWFAIYGGSTIALLIVGVVLATKVPGMLPGAVASSSSGTIGADTDSPKRKSGNRNPKSSSGPEERPQGPTSRPPSRDKFIEVIPKDSPDEQRNKPRPGFLAPTGGAPVIASKPNPSDAADRRPKDSVPKTTTPNKIVRLPIPKSEEVAEADQRVTDLVGPEPKKKDLPFYAQTLLNNVAKFEGDPAGQYNILDRALQTTAEIPDYILAKQVLAKYEQLFEVDSLKLKSTTIELFAKGVKDADGPVFEPLQLDAIPLLDQLTEGDRFDLAIDMHEALLELTESVELLTFRDQLTTRTSFIERGKKKFKKFSMWKATLEETPDDAATNKKMGYYYCFFKNDWKTGLSFLTRSGVDALEDAARLDLQQPVQPDERVDLGADWLEASKKLGRKVPDGGRAKIVARAQHWMMSALASAEGEAREIIEQRLMEANLVTVNPLDMKFMLIPAGEFTQGSPPTELTREKQGIRNIFGDVEPNSETQHRVRITKPFQMGIYEVTQDQFQTVMNYVPNESPGGLIAVHNISLREALEFCKRLSAMDSKANYRLPTEAEWEYACRAGSTKAFGVPRDANQSPDDLGCARLKNTQAHIGLKNENGGSPVAVGSFRPNAWGLFDMHGNVEEWVMDLYDSGYYNRLVGQVTSDPFNNKNGNLRIARGGSWVHFGGFCRSAVRHVLGGLEKKNDIGFRVIRIGR